MTSNPTAAATLHHDVQRAARAVLSTQVISQLISIGSLAILFRWIVPEEYGLLAAVTPALMLPRMAASLGTSAATIQRPSLSNDETSALFWLQTGASLAASIVTALCGPWLAWQYSEPRLAPLCYWLAGSTLAGSLGATHLALLERQLRLETLSRIRLVAQLIGAAAAMLVAYRQPTVLALVAQQYGELLTLSLGGWLAHRWLPSIPKSKVSLGSLVNFSGVASLAHLVFYLAQNLHLFLLPLILPETFRGPLGLYTQAYNLMMKPVYLVTSPLSSVMLAGVARALEQRHDPTPVVARIYRMSAILLFPIATGLFATALELMPLLGGANWKPASVILAILAPVILVQGLLNLACLVLTAYGRLTVLLTMSIVSLVMLAQTALLALFTLDLGALSPEEAWQGAIRLAVATSAVTCLIVAPPQLYLVLRACGLSVSAVLLPLVRPLRAAVIMGAIVMLARAMLMKFPEIGDPMRLLILVPLGVAIYLAMAWPEVKWLRANLLGASLPEPTVAVEKTSTKPRKKR